MTFTETGLDLRLERMLIGVTPKEAFDAWFDAKGRESWYSPAGAWTIEASNDLRVGGKWRAAFGETPDATFTEEGEYLEIDPPHRAVYTNTFTFPDGRSFTTLNVVQFEAAEGGTRLVVEDRGYPNAEQRDAHAQGWPSFLDNFARFVTSG